MQNDTGQAKVAATLGEITEQKKDRAKARPKSNREVKQVKDQSVTRFTAHLGGGDGNDKKKCCNAAM